MTTPAKRLTFRLHQPTIEGIEELVRGGIARSRNTLIEHMVTEALRAYRRQQREAEAFKQYRAAFDEPAYRAEQDSLLHAFEPADIETASRIE